VAQRFTAAVDALLLNAALAAEGSRADPLPYAVSCTKRSLKRTPTDSKNSAALFKQSRRSGTALTGRTDVSVKRHCF
jgi:hypothetical protein